MHDQLGDAPSLRLDIGIAVLLLPLALALPAAAQDTAGTFEGSTRVVEVQVPVNVINKSGEPVRGLTAADFEVLDEGIEREVLDLEVIDLDVLQPETEGGSTGRIEAAIPAAARRHVLLLFDLSFSNPMAVIRAREAAREFVLNDLHPTDLVAVAIHTVEGGAKLVITFTPDRAQLARAIDTLGAPRLLRALGADPLRFMLEGAAEISGGIASQDLNNTERSSEIRGFQQDVLAYLNVIGKQMAKMENSFARGRISSWSRSMGSLARMMDSVSGRKHVVYFSEGFDGRLVLGRRPDFEDFDAQNDQLNIQFGQFFMVDTDDIYGNTQLQIEFAQMVEEFRRADCLIQAVDISGLGSENAERQRIDQAGQDAMFYVANETGGGLYKDANRFRPQLAKVLERSTVTYLLTFHATDLPTDGSYRRLKVKADVPRGTRLSHREGYFAPRPFGDLHPLEKNLLASDAIAAAAPRSGIDLNVLAAPFRANAERAYVPVIIEVSGASLVDGHVKDFLGIELYTYVTDVRGEMKDFFTQMVTLDITRSRDRFEGAGLKYYGHLDLGPGDYLVRVLVRNADTGRTGVRSVEVNIPKYDGSDPVLLPPFIVDKSNEWFLVREERGAAYEKTVIYPFTVNGEPYVPAAFPMLREGEEVRLCLVAYNLGAGAVELDSRILTEDGQPVDGGMLALVERTVTGIDGLDKLLATFDATGLDAGRYTLEVDVADPANGLLKTNSIPFAVLN